MNPNMFQSIANNPPSEARPAATNSDRLCPCRNGDPHMMDQCALMMAFLTHVNGGLNLSDPANFVPIFGTHFAPELIKNLLSVHQSFSKLDGLPNVYNRAVALFKGSPLFNYTGHTYASNVPGIPQAKQAHDELMRFQGGPMKLQSRMYIDAQPATYGDDPAFICQDYVILMTWMRVLFRVSATRCMYLPLTDPEPERRELSPFARLILKHHIQVPRQLIPVDHHDELTCIETSNISNFYCWFSFRTREIYARAVKRTGLASQDVGFDITNNLLRSRERSGIFRNDFAQRIEEKGAYVLQSGVVEIIDGHVASPEPALPGSYSETQRVQPGFIVRALGLAPTVVAAHQTMDAAQTELRQAAAQVSNTLGEDNIRKLVTEAVASSGIKDALAKASGSVSEFYAELKQLIDALVVIAPMALCLGTVVTAYCHWTKPSTSTRILLGTLGSLSVATSGYAIFKNFPQIMAVIKGDDKIPAQEADVFEFASAVCAIAAAFGFGGVSKDGIIRTLSQISPLKRSFDVICSAVLELLAMVAPTIKTHTGWDLMSRLYSDPEYTAWYAKVEELMDKVRDGFLPMPDVDLDKLNRLILGGESLMSDLTAVGKGQLANVVRSMYMELLKLKREVNRVVKSTAQVRMVPVSILLYGEPHAGKTACANAIKLMAKELCCKDDEEKRSEWDKNEKQFVYKRDGDKFFTNMTNDCAIVMYDDLFQEREVVGMDASPSVEIIGIVNQEEFVPRMAGVEDKGKVSARPQFVISTTNKKKLDSEVITQQTALARRFHIVLHLGRIEAGLEIKAENFNITLASIETVNNTCVFERGSEKLTLAGLFRKIRTQYEEHIRIAKEMNQKVDQMIADILEGVKEEERFKGKPVPPKYAAKLAVAMASVPVQQSPAEDIPIPAPAIMIPDDARMISVDLSDQFDEAAPWTLPMVQVTADDIVASSTTDEVNDQDSVEIVNMDPLMRMSTILHPIQILPVRAKAAGHFVANEQMVVIEPVEASIAERLNAGTSEFGCSKNGALRRVDNGGESFWYRPYFFNVTYTDTIVFMRNYAIAESDLAVIDDEFVPDFKKGCVKIGDTYFPKDQIFQDAFTIKMRLNIEDNFWGVMWEIHAGTVFFNTEVGSTYKVRYGVHWYSPGEAAQKIFMTALGRRVTIPVPFISWYEKHFAAPANASQSGYSVELDTWALATYIADTVLAIAIEPMTLYKALKEKVPSMKDWSRKSVADWVLGHTPDSLITYVAVGAASAATMWDKTREAIRSACHAVRDGFMWAMRSVCAFLQKHAAMITVLGGMAATALGAFFFFAKGTDAPEDDEYASPQSGQGAGLRPKPQRGTRAKKAAVKQAARPEAGTVQQLGVQKITDSTLKLQKNQYFIGSMSQDGGKYARGVATFTHERHFITVGHIMRKIHRDTERTGSRMYLEQSSKTMTFEAVEYEVHEDIANDFARVEIRQNGFPQHKDIRDMFAANELLCKYTNNSAHFESRLVGPNAVESSMITLYTPEHPVKTLEGEVINMSELFQHNVRTVPGDCGTLLMLADGTTGGQIIGYHLAGNGRCGFAKAICIEDLYDYFGDEYEAPPQQQDESILDLDAAGETKAQSVPYDPDVHCGTILSSDARIPSGIFARHSKEKFHGGGPLPMPYQKALSNVGPQYYEKARGGYAPTGATVDPKLMYTIGQSIGQRLRTLHKWDFRMLSMLEVIKGVKGTSIKSLDVSTSSGYPWQEVGMGKDTMWTYGPNETVVLGPNWPILHEVCNMKYSVLMEGGRPMFIYKDTLKAELRGIQKVRDGKSRLVSASPIDKTILMKMAFGAFNMAFGDNPITSYAMIGANPYGEDWNMAGKLLQDYCEGEDRAGACDYEGWDKHLNPDIGMILRGAIDAFYADQSEAEKRMRHTLLDDCFSSVHIRGEIIEKWCDESGRGFGWPSGNYLTAPGNSTMNLGTYIYHFLKFYKMDMAKLPDFWKEIMVLILGDDNLFAVRKKLGNWFLETNLAATAAEMGMVLTSDVKGAVNTELRPMTEVSILKRKWRWEDSAQRWVAPQDLMTIIETCMWTQRTSYNQTAAQNMEFTVRELSLHGKDVYEQWLPRLQRFHPGAKCYHPWDVAFAQTLTAEAYI
nr:MAG: RNA-dependent RNA polymerase [Chemarfal virus 29]